MGIRSEEENVWSVGNWKVRGGMEAGLSGTLWGGATKSMVGMQGRGVCKS